MDAIRQLLSDVSKHLRDDPNYSGDLELYSLRKRLRETLAAPEQTDLRERLDAAVDEGERRWKTEGHCHEADCGCWTEWVKRELAALPLLPQPAAPDEARVREWAESFTKQVCDYPAQSREFIGIAWEESDKGKVYEWFKRQLLDFAKSFPPSGDAERAAPNTQSESIDFEWVNRTLACDCATKEKQTCDFCALRGLIKSLSRSPAPLKLSRDEIVKRGDAKTCEGCKATIPICDDDCELGHAGAADGRKRHITRDGIFINHSACTGRGTAIYELVLAAAPPAQAVEGSEATQTFTQAELDEAVGAAYRAAAKVVSFYRSLLSNETQRELLEKIYAEIIALASAAPCSSEVDVEAQPSNLGVE